MRSTSHLARAATHARSPTGRRQTVARILLLAALGSAIASNAAPASAAPALHDVGPVATEPATGGEQLVADRTRLAYMPVAGRVRVIDERLTEVAAVSEPGCSWRDFGGGAVLWSCFTPGSTWPLSLYGSSFPLDEIDGGRRTVLGPPSLSLGGHGEAPSWWRVGRHWMTAFYDGSSAIHTYVNRATGAVDYTSNERRRAARRIRLITDVDQADLTRRVCAPLAPRLVGEFPTEIAPLVYRPPYGATRIGARMLMAHCGAHRMTVLSRCTQTCSDPVIGDHFVAWTEGDSTRRTVYVRLVDRGRTWRWQVPAPSSQRPVAAVGRRLFVLGQGRLLTVRLPPVARNG